MKITFKDKETENSFFNSFSINKGEVVVLFLSSEGDFKIEEEREEKKFNVQKNSVHVSIQQKRISKISFDIIIENMNYLSQFISFRQISSRNKFIYHLSGVEFRILDMFLMRKELNKTFFEVNTAGLSVNSVRILFEFIFKELKEANGETSYLIIESKNEALTKNPMFITEDNYNKFYEEIYLR